MVRRLAFAVPILTLAASSALAQPSLVQPLAQPASPAVAEPDVVVTSYRDQILLASAIGAGALIGAAVAEGEDGRDTEASDLLYGTGAAAMFLAPSVIHFAHGEVGRGFASFGLRSAMATIGGLVAMEIHHCDPDTDGWFCDLDALGPGLLVGVGVASLIDAFTMTDQRRYRAPGERMLAPVVSASSDGGRVGLVGTF